MTDFGFYKGKKVFVTGHTGFKGSWLCEVLTMLGADVTGYSLNPPTDPALFNILSLKERMRGCLLVFLRASCMIYSFLDYLVFQYWFLCT